MAICYKSTGKSYPLEGDFDVAQKTAAIGSGVFTETYKR